MWRLRAVCAVSRAILGSSAGAGRHELASRGYFVDGFAGNLGITRGSFEAGLNARFFDTKYGEKYDLTLPRVYRTILNDISNGAVLAANLAPPCGTFSVAFDRGTAVRSAKIPWGFENLPQTLQQQVRTANQTMRIALRIFGHCLRNGIPGILENLQTSRV